ncbi:hypothetical protein D3C71_2128090 [compost metagenome]
MQAGLHLCVPLGSLAREHELIDKAAAVGVELSALSGYCLADPAQPPRAGLVLGFAGVDEAQIALALDKLRRAWR